MCKNVQDVCVVLFMVGTCTQMERIIHLTFQDLGSGLIDILCTIMFVDTAVWSKLSTFHSLVFILPTRNTKP